MFEDLVDKVVTPQFKTDIEYAMKHPKSTIAKNIITKVSPILLFQESSNLYTPFDQEKMHGKMLSMSRRYGGVSSFITVAPDSIANATSYRMSLKHVNNQNFPVDCDADFLKCVQEGSVFVASETVRINCNYALRAEAIIANPLPSVLEYISLIDNLFVELLGIKPSNGFPTLNVNKEKKTVYYKNRNTKGIFGPVLGAALVTEAQNRHDLHCHILFFGGMSPHLLQSGASYKTISKQIQMSLDKMYQQCLPRKIHLFKQVYDYCKTNQFTVSCDHENQPQHLSSLLNSVRYHHPGILNSSEWKTNLNLLAVCLNIHQHSFTCKKGVAGMTHCRMKFGRPLEKKTCAVVLEEKRYDGCQNKQAFVLSSSIKRETHRVLQPKKRVILWNVKRPKLEEMCTKGVLNIDPNNISERNRSQEYIIRWLFNDLHLENMSPATMKIKEELNNMINMMETTNLLKFYNSINSGIQNAE